MNRFERFATQGGGSQPPANENRFARFTAPTHTQANPVSELEALGSGAADALTFGFGDEMLGVIGGDEARDRSRRQQEAARAARPGYYLGGQVAGSLAGGLGAGVGARLALRAAPAAAAALNGVNWAGRAGIAAATGAAGGAAYGAGDARGGVEERLPGAVRGGTIGAVGGGALSLAGSAIGPVARRVMEGRSPERVAQGILAQGIRREGMDEAGFRAALSQHASMNRGGMVLDTLGESGGHIAGGAASHPSAGRSVIREAMDARNNAAGQQASNDAWRTLRGGKPEDPADVLVALRDTQRTTAGPLYERTWREVGRVDPADMQGRVGEIIRRHPAIFGPARTLADELSLAETGARIGDEADPRFWHYMLQGAEIELGKRLRAGAMGDIGGFRGTQAAIYSRAVREFNDQVRDRLGPTFRQAQDTFSGAERAREAVERGYEAVGPSLNSLQLGELREFMRRARPGEIEHIRIGALSRLTDMLRNADTGSGRADVLRVIMRSDGQRAILEQLFGGRGGFQALMQRLDYDRQLFQNTANTGIRMNSLTGSNLGAAAAQGAAATTPATTSGGIIERLLGPEIQRAASARNEDVSDALLRALSTPAKDALASMSGPAGTRGLFGNAARQAQQLEEFRRKRALESALGGGFVAPALTGAQQYSGVQ